LALPHTSGGVEPEKRREETTFEKFYFPQEPAKAGEDSRNFTAGGLFTRPEVDAVLDNRDLLGLILESSEPKLACHSARAPRESRVKPVEPLSQTGYLDHAIPGVRMVQFGSKTTGAATR